MALVILPPDHRDADLSLASRIATEMRLEELHVFLSLDGAAAPPRIDAGAPEPRGPLASALGVLDELFERIADLLAPWSAGQPKTGKLRRRASRSTPDCSAATTSRSLRST